MPKDSWLSDTVGTFILFKLDDEENSYIVVSSVVSKDDYDIM